VSLSRRGLLAGLAGLAAGGLVPAPSAAASGRLRAAFEKRLAAARKAEALGAPEHRTNGDAGRDPQHLFCYSKGLPHNARGEVDPQAYRFLEKALESGESLDFERIPLGGFVKLANPQAAWAFDLVGPDASQPAMPPPPRFDSAEQASEMVEMYAHALARDVPFAEYESDPGIARLCLDLTRAADFRGPRRDGRVIPATIFRGGLRGDLAGPYVSQFLLKEVPFLPLRVEQRIRTAVPGVDYLTGYDDWLGIENGKLAGVNRFDAQTRFLRNGRDLGEYVHRDWSFQAFQDACLMALKMGVLPDGGNPYKHSRTQTGFATFGQPYLLYLLAVVSQVALQVSWFQKWRVHRRIRPEELGGRVENLLRGVDYPLHANLREAWSLEEVRRRYGTALLPQAYPEGCPTHPSYPAGHAIVAGACATVLKACFDESHIVPEPVVASPDGMALQPWRGGELTIGGELDKLASNIALGRDFAGLHFRSDSLSGMRLGEEVAIAVLAEMALTGNELFEGWSVERFDGRRVTVS
jgi:hypothetical protein